jgi:ssDNA-binding Zn-finger/Zn-ribbon topoisomerase 1
LGRNFRKYLIGEEMKYFKEIKKCRICGNKKLIKLLRFEKQFIGSTFVKDNKSHTSSKIKIPLIPKISNSMHCEDTK